MKYKAVAIGCSTGGLKAVTEILRRLPSDFPLPIVVLSHQESNRESAFAELLGRVTDIPVVEIKLGMAIAPGKIFVAPPTFHLFLEPDHSFSFSMDTKVSYSRPSVDVLFESMADVYGPFLIGVVLTGANSDGANGLKKIRDFDGIGIVQNPDTSQAPEMPEISIERAGADYILDARNIADCLVELSKKIIQPRER